MIATTRLSCPSSLTLTTPSRLCLIRTLIPPMHEVSLLCVRALFLLCFHVLDVAQQTLADIPLNLSRLYDRFVCFKEHYYVWSFVSAHQIPHLDLLVAITVPHHTRSGLQFYPLVVGCIGNPLAGVLVPVSSLLSAPWTVGYWFCTRGRWYTGLSKVKEANMGPQTYTGHFCLEYGPLLFGFWAKMCLFIE